MASRSAKSPKGRKRDEDFEEEGGVGPFLMRHRVFVGGLTAFAVAFAYVAANALWYQPHAHGGAFFPTRPAAEPASQLQSQVDAPWRAVAAQQQMPDKMDVEAIIRRQAATPALEAEPQPASAEASGDAAVEDVQRMLAALDLYDGDVDGISGPQTESAVASYRKMTGLPVSSDIDAELIERLRSSERAVVPTPAPTAAEPEPDRMATATTTTAEPDPMVERIQAGLKAFGNEGIEVDGVVGERTRLAILEFQSLFGLPQTGEPDQALYAKMREIGLTN